jgi:hypothetical protein
MTKTSKAARKTTTVKVRGVHLKATPVRRRKAVIAAPAVEPAVAEVSMAETLVEVPVAEAQVAAPAVEPLFFIPDLGVSDLLMGREGRHQLPGKTWHRLSGRFGKSAVRQAIAVMEALPDLRMPLAMELVTWPSYRPHMVEQLSAVKANPDVMNVLGWVWMSGEGWSWKEAYAAFPRHGFPGGKATKREIGKFNKLVSLLDAIRKEGKTSIRGIDLLAQAAHLIGWIK